MKCNTHYLRPPRAAVLVVCHPDGHLEAFAERHVDVHLARVPFGFNTEGDAMAEDVALDLLPRRYRDLWRADRLRAVGTTRPLLPSVMADAEAVTVIIDALNSATRAMTPEQEEAVAWTL